ncbi:MAG: UDP-N-acetylmuramoyl-L-alanine--D-glutamate ligase [Rubrivivax sp.]|nr:UDP-N-acetylmuramoyl-L-alanine--D-glutamate ligase [Rubrivivax sp.]
MDFLRDLPVLILGLGDSGLAMARWCARHGADVTVWDSRENPPQAAALQAEVPGARRIALLPLPPAGEGWGRSAGFEPHAASALSGPGLQAGTRTASEGSGVPPPSPQPSPASGRGGEDGRPLGGAKLVLKSPGLSPHDPLIAPLLQQARATGIPAWGELDLYLRALADLKTERGYTPQILAITGTNGKTTTTAMTALLVARTGRKVASAGNIGPTLLDTLAARLDDLPEVWVLELSSFQLEGGGDGVRDFEPDAATVLNVTQDHLDWHGSMAAYAAAKARIFGTRAVMVINADDPLVTAMVPAPVAAAVKGKGKGKPAERSVLRFGLEAPRRPGDFGLVVENGMAWLVRALPADETVKRPRGGGAALEGEIHLQRLMPADALRVRGRHNAANALAALALATAIGCPLAPMLHGLREYSGEPHRVQFVATVGEVEAYDDSKGTNVGATVAALDGLGADKVPAKLVVILGGDGKGQDFAPLAAPLARHARAVATIGLDAAVIEAAIESAPGSIPLQRHATLEAAVAWCFEQARPGDAVLLSPACASLDMFRNYGHRAEVFVNAVQALAHERGQA